MDNAGLVFAGGGVKGAYQIGVWRALGELGINVSAVVGTSIGAINAALFVQRDIERAYRLWTDISPDKVINISAAAYGNLVGAKNILTFIAEAYKNGGIDTSPLLSLLKSVINEDMIRKSDIEYGLAAYSVSGRREVQIFKSDIPNGKMAEYIMASASMPGFKSQKIGDEDFIDGCVSNNIPVDMLVNKNYRNIIAVDVGGVGVVKSVNTSGINLFMVKCSDMPAGTLEFDSNNIKRSIRLGYYDCMKTFGRLCGHRYFFYSGDYYYSKRKYSDHIMRGIECAASAFKIDRIVVYKVENLIEGILRGYACARGKYMDRLSEFRQDGFIEVFKKGHTKIDDSLVVAWIADMIMKKDNNYLKGRLTHKIFRDNFCAAEAVIYFLGEKRAGWRDKWN